MWKVKKPFKMHVIVCWSAGNIKIQILWHAVYLHRRHLKIAQYLHFHILLGAWLRQLGKILRLIFGRKTILSTFSMFAIRTCLLDIYNAGDRNYNYGKLYLYKKSDILINVRVSKQLRMAKSGGNGWKFIFNCYRGFL